jgi:hypothetical protein
METWLNWWTDEGSGVAPESPRESPSNTDDRWDMVSRNSVPMNLFSEFQVGGRD